MRTMLTLVLTAAMVAPLYAQRPQRGQGGRGGFGGMMGTPTGAGLLASEDVQKELKLTDEQKEKYKAFATKQQETRRELFGGGGQRPDREKMQEIQKKLQEEGAAFVKDTLTSDQGKRLKQIGLQVGGVMAFNGEETQKELKITDEQKEKIKSIVDQMQKDLREARGGAGGGRPMAPTPEQLKKIEALRKEALEKVTDVLTSDQKKTWEAMVGPKFEGKIQPPGVGRRNRGGAGGQ